MSARAVLVTGASGYLGRKLIRALASEREGIATVVAADVREPDAAARQPGILYAGADVRDRAGLERLLGDHAIDTVVHLATLVTPHRDEARSHAFAVDVEGTRNVLDACLSVGARKLVVTSSGAAYGYHADNPEPLDEDDALRGNESFAYAHHKKLVEQMLAQARRDHPHLQQLVFRPGTVLGEDARNQITALFEMPVVLGVAGAATPFVFVWDEDVVACLVRGIREPVTGVYNLAGDGVVTMREIARRAGRPYLPLPAGLLQGALGALRRLGLTRYGPEQVAFLRYRPVLSNRRLREQFGYQPRLSSSEVLDLYLRSRGRT